LAYIQPLLEVKTLPNSPVGYRLSLARSMTVEWNTTRRLKPWVDITD